MSSQTPGPDDPLAALAKAAEQAVRTEERERAAGLEANASRAAGRRRAARAVALVVMVAALAGVIVVQGPRILDPYHGDDPLGDPHRAKAYLAGLLDDVAAYRARNRGRLPLTLELAVAESRLPPQGSAYRLEYRIEDDAPILTLQGGREPVTMRGPGR